MRGNLINTLGLALSILRIYKVENEGIIMALRKG